jgi:class 3 adenylate cyclase
MFRCFELGADDYITKPFEPTLLNARLNSYLEKKKLKDKEKIYLNTIREEKDKSERLLLNILPAEIAERLKSGETTIADKLNNVTILFADLVNFTRLSKKLSPSDLVELLNTIFRKFDDICDAYSMEKIKTIGDSYLAASGIPKPIKTHTENAMKMATDILKYIEEIKAYGSELNIRIGMHSGPIVAGVIGKKKFVYDLWGDTVNIASRMESQGSTGKIHVTGTVMKKLKDQYNFESCGKKEFKGVGKINTYYLLEDKK